MSRKIESEKTTPKSTMDHNVRQIVPDANNTIGKKIFSGINTAVLLY